MKRNCLGWLCLCKGVSLRKRTEINSQQVARQVCFWILSNTLLLLASVLVIPEFAPERTSATPGVVPTPTISISPSSTASISLSPGTFGSTTQTISVSTTNYTGYTLTLETSGSSTSLVNTSDSSLTIPTVTSTAGTALNALNNNYGYSLDGNLFYPVPAPQSSVELGSSNISGTNSHSLVFGAHAGNATVAGTYENTFLISAVANDALFEINFEENAGSDIVDNMPLASENTLSGATVILSETVPERDNYIFLEWNTEDDGSGDSYLPGGELLVDGELDESGNTVTLYAIWEENACPSGNICYAGNGDDRTGAMANQSASSNASVVLLAPNFSKPGYAFLGWNTNKNGGGTLYGAQGTIRTGDLSSEGLTLYATWLASSGTLQNWTGCSAMSTGDVVALSDFRDGQVYTVAKLADGNCWITANLRLDLSSAKLSAANTNSPTSSFVASAKVSSQTATMCGDNTQSCIDRVAYNTSSINRGLAPSYNAETSTNSWYSYGVYYNWFTATAGNGTYDNTTGSVSGDICPAGWRLPTAGTGGEYVAMNVAVNSGSTTSDLGLRTYPANFVYSGDYNQTKSTGRGRYARIWSATAVSATTAYRFGLGEGQVTPVKYYNKWDAFAVRCVARSDTTTLSGNIHYEGNGGTGTMADDLNVNLYAAAAKPNTFTPPTNAVFKEWNTAADGSGTAVEDGDMVADAARQMNITSGGTLTLYAIYGGVSTLTYDANGGSNAPDPATVVGVEGVYTFTISNQVPVREDYAFEGWSLDPNAATPDYVAHDTFTTTNSAETLYAVWRALECGPNHICFWGNSADEGEAVELATSSNTSQRLWSPNFSREGYGFAGWNTANDGSGTTYGSAQTINTGNVSVDGLVLYATWVASSGDLQNWSGCSAMSTGDVIALTDNRDNNTYAVAKLADGKCWMTENLRLDPSAVEFTSANTNSPTSSFVTEAAASSSSNVMCGGDGGNNSACIDKVAFYANNINRALVAAPEGTSVTSSWYSYGVLYNWYTATAGNGTFSMTSGSASGDICPAGWRLPTSGTNGGEFAALNTAINGGSVKSDAGLRTYPANFVYAGDHNQSANGGRGTYARLWSSTASSANNAYRFGFITSEVTPLKNYNKWVAFAVRCVAQ